MRGNLDIIIRNKHYNGICTESKRGKIWYTRIGILKDFSIKFWSKGFGVEVEGVIASLWGLKYICKSRNAINNRVTNVIVILKIREDKGDIP
jgi:hypothetical protein